MILYNAVAMRMRDRTDVSVQIADLSRGTTDLARQVAEFGRRLASVELRLNASESRTHNQVGPLAGEALLLAPPRLLIGRLLLSEELFLLRDGPALLIQLFDLPSLQLFEMRQLLAAERQLTLLLFENSAIGVDGDLSSFEVGRDLGFALREFGFVGLKLLVIVVKLLLLLRQLVGTPAQLLLERLARLFGLLQQGRIATYLIYTFLTPVATLLAVQR